MKKIAALIIVLSLLLFIVGCDSYAVKQGRIQVAGEEVSEDTEDCEETEEICTVELIEEPSEELTEQTDEEPEETLDDEHI